MQVSDLTDDDIGRCVWVRLRGERGWQRICFEGFTVRPGNRPANLNGGSPFWVILRCPPSTRGAMTFRRADGQVITGVLTRSTEDVYPVEVDWGVSSSGEIVELGERAA